MSLPEGLTDYVSILEYFGAYEVSDMELYGDVFKLGTGFLTKAGEHRDSHEFNGNPIILGSFDEKIRREMVFEDTFEEQLRRFQEQADWAILNGLTYWGRVNDGQHQNKLCAFVFDYDIDKQKQVPKKLYNFLYGAFSESKLYPIPNYMVLSSHNVHLYYVLEEPLDLFPIVKTQAKKLKHELSRIMMNRYTTNIEKPDAQGINQGFRIVGGRTKGGEGVAYPTVRAFRLNEHPFSIEELNERVPEDARVQPGRKSKYTIEQVKKQFPEWYEQVIVGGRRTTGRWVVKEDLYRWWLKKAYAEAVPGHRYYCVMALAVFAAKCGILDKGRVRRDAESLLEKFNDFAGAEPFTKKDIKSALECLDLRFCNFSRKELESYTGVPMPPNKRNGLKQDQHLYLARRRKEDMKAIGLPMKNPEGRPKGSQNKDHPKKNAIRAYAAEHPDASHAAIAKALCVSRTTVIKWLKPDAVVAPPADNAEGYMSIEEAVEKAIDEHLSLLIRKHGQVIMTDREDLDSEGVLVDRLKKGGDWAFGRFFERVAEENGKCRDKLSDQGLVDKPMQLKL